MALQTKTFSSATTSNGFTLVLTVTENSTSIDTNTSSVSYSLDLKSGGWNFAQWRIGWSISLGGTVVSSQAKGSAPQFTLGTHSSITIKSGTATIAHNSDGKKSMSVSASIDMSKASYTPGPMSLSGSMSLTDIPRASSLSFGGFTIGSAGTITINRASTAFTHTLSYVFGSTSGTIATKTTAASVSWTPPTSLLSQIPASVSGSGTITCITYSGSAEIGRKTVGFTAAAAAAVKPTISSVTITPVNSNTWLSSKGIYVAGRSKARVVTSASPGAGSSMASYGITGVGDGSGADWTSNVLSTGSKTITITAADRRGRTDTTTRSITVLAYSVPGINNLSYARGTYSGGVWTANDNGADIQVTFTLGLSLSDYSNTANITVQLDGVTKSSATAQAAGEKVYYIAGVGTDTTRALTVSATDQAGETGSVSADIPTVSVDFNWNPDLHSWRFGGVAEESDCFRCDWISKFAGGMQIGNLSGILKASNGTVSTAVSGTDYAPPAADYIVQQGTSGIWTYRKWSSGVAECWGTQTVTNATFAAWGSAYSYDVPTVAFPSGLFTALAYESAQAKCTGYNTISSINANGGTTSTASGITLLRMTAAAENQTITAYRYAIGRWK